MKLPTCTLCLFFLAISLRAEEVLLFEEPFEDTNWEAHGWYDGPHMEISADEHIANSLHSCVWNWPEAGAISTSGGGARLHLPPQEDILLEFHIKHSSDWTWTGVPWHPHEFHFITSADAPYVGPAYTHLTFYVEVVNGVPRLAIQDGRNIDESRIGEDLTTITENRSVAGCNGDSDGYGPGDCYRSGETHNNGKFWEADTVYFGDAPGTRYKADWHQVRARFRLNSIRDGVGQPDGIVQYWFDGALLVDHRDVLLRTGAHPDMQIDQFLMAPYYGPGVPHSQKIWIDDLKIYAITGAELQETGIEGPDSTWGRIKKRID